MKFVNILLLFFCITHGASVFAISDAQLAQEIRSTLARGQYSAFEKLLRGHDELPLITIFPGQDKGGQKHLQFLDAIVNNTYWQNNSHLVIYADRALRVLLSIKLSSSAQKKFRSLQAKVTSVSNSNDALARGMDLEGTAEIITLPQGAFSRSAVDKNKQVHVYKAVLRRWFMKWKKARSKMDFASYVKKSIPKKVKVLLSNSIMEYLTPQEAEKYVVSFQNGVLFLDGQQLGDGNYMFVLNAAGTKLYIAKKKTGRFHHSSFVGGDPVQCAGRVTTLNGEISELSLHSGHYHPIAANGRRLLQFLSDPSRLGAQALYLKIATKDY